MSRGLLSLFALLLAAGLLRAHPVPKDNHDRTLSVHLTPAGVAVDYRIEVDEFRAVRDLPAAALQGVESRKDIHHAFRRYFAATLADNLVAELDGKRLTFRCVEQRSAVLDHVRCDYRFVADWALTPGGTHRFAFREANYPFDDVSLVVIRLSHGARLTLNDERRDADEPRVALTATVVNVPSYEGVIRPAMPADLDAARPGVEGLSRYAASAKRRPREPGGIVRDNPPPEEPEPTSLPKKRTLLNLLLDTKTGLAMLLLLSAVIGAAHALTPGHGKTLVAAYLVGQHGTVWHALILGLATTLAHTGSVIAVAVLLAATGVATHAAAVVLNLVGGLLITGLGLWLLMQRLRGAADHVHLGGGHDAPDLSKPGASWWSALVLGLGGGIIPCFDAIGLLSFAIAVKRLWLGVVLLVAFSVGLAAVLVALGLLVVAAQAGARALRLEGRFERVARALPIASAVVITLIGLLMTFGGAAAAH